MNSAVQAGADAHWYGHYGFDRDPFAEGGVHGLFYPGGARQETVQQLLHLARNSDCVLLVTGVAGAGKSATRRHFAAQTAPDTRCCVVEAALLDSPEQFLRRVLAGFALRAQANLDADLHTLAEHCAARNAARTRCWLVIDDAHDLHEDVVRILPQLLKTTAPHLRLVLFAEPRWRSSLHAALPPDVALHTLELQAFEQGETYAYIHYRLNTAGLEGEPPFNAQEFLRIHQQSGGNPGRINAVAREILRDAAAQVQQPLSALPLWHFAVIAATLLALLLLYAWGAIDQDDHRPTRSAAPDVVARAPSLGPVPSLQIAPEAEPEPAAPGAPPADDTTGAAGQPQPIDLAAQTASEPDPIAVEPDADVDADADAVTDPDASASAADTRPTKSGPPPAAQVTPAPAVVSPVQDTVATQRAPADGAGPGTPESPSQAVPSAASAGAGQSGATDIASGASEQGIAGPATADEGALLAMDSGHYVLQVMASDDGRRVREFAARSGMQVHLYRKRHNGRDWFALVHGEYATRAEAEAALNALPETLRGARPWVRRVDGIQQEIRNSRAR